MIINTYYYIIYNSVRIRLRIWIGDPYNYIQNHNRILLTVFPHIQIIPEFSYPNPIHSDGYPRLLVLTVKIAIPRPGPLPHLGLDSTVTRGPVHAQWVTNPGNALAHSHLTSEYPFPDARSGRVPFGYFLSLGVKKYHVLSSSSSSLYIAAHDQQN